jgi:hypothetical protein
VTERVHSLRGLLLRRLWLPLLVLLLCSAVGSFALARFYAGQVYDRWLLDSAMSLSELVTVQDGRASIEITPRCRACSPGTPPTKCMARWSMPRAGACMATCPKRCPAPRSLPG